MHRKTWILLTLITLFLAACAQKPVVQSQRSSSQAMSGQHMMDDMTGSATATPGSMMAEESMGHGMEPITAKHVQPAESNQGGQPLSFREENGAKVFALTARAVKWQILDGVVVTAYTYNGSVPGPMIRVTEGDRVRVVVKDELDVPTSVHFHGVQLPNSLWMGFRM